MSAFPQARVDRAIGEPSLDPEPAEDAIDEGGDSVLARAASLRFPELRELGGGAQKIEALVDHITATAILRGDVEELRLAANAKLLNIRKRLGRIPASGRDRSRTEEARRAVAPELAEEHDHWQWIVARCAEQINRLDRDYDAASRAYTLLAT